MFIMKFGGSSVGTAESIVKVFDIVARQVNTKILVVLSALKGITDDIFALTLLAKQNELLQAQKRIDAIKDRHLEMIREAVIGADLQKQAEVEIEKLTNKLSQQARGISLLRELAPAVLDKCLSYGEKLSTTVFYFISRSRNLPCILFSAERVIKTDDVFGKGNPDYKSIRDNAQNELLPIFDNYDVIITQGFIGSTTQGKTTTLGRGGSDLSASLFGMALSADEIQIWTDVSGVLSTDPRLAPEAVTISSMSLSEIRELSFFGAKVLHPETIKPAMQDNIPIKVLNTFEPENCGTTIRQEKSEVEPNFHSVTAKNNILSINISLNSLSASNKQILDIFAIFERYGITALASSSSESSFTAFVEPLADREIALLREGLFGYDFAFDSGSLICLVGSRITESTALFDKFHSAVKHLPVKYILYGNSAESIFIFAGEEHSHSLQAALHNIIVA